MKFYSKINLRNSRSFIGSSIPGYFWGKILEGLYIPCLRYDLEFHIRSNLTIQTIKENHGPYVSIIDKRQMYHVGQEEVFFKTIAKHTRFSSMRVFKPFLSKTC